jgi:sulfur relay protein TusB/DsrH
MIVLVKSAPATTDGMRGIALAQEGGAGLILLQNGVFFGQKGRLSDFQGRVYVLGDDKRLRGLKDCEMDARARTIDYDKLTDIITEGENVVGMF